MDTQEYINKVLQDGDEKSLEFINGGVHLIRTLSTSYARKKDLIAIDYKVDLLSGIRLDPVHQFTNDGLMDNTTYYYEGKPVLKVSETYNYNSTDEANSQMNISKRGIHSRVKTWNYYFEDGTLDTSGNEGTFKIKEKFYKTDIEGLVVGAKRRHNIQIILSERAGALLVIMGVFSNSKEVKDAMRNVSARYSADFQEFEKYGTENIITSIENDTDFNWLNTYIPTNQDLENMVNAGQMTNETKAQLQGAFQYYDLTNIQGMTIRQYFSEKLKGNIK